MLFNHLFKATISHFLALFQFCIEDDRTYAIFIKELIVYL